MVAVDAAGSIDDALAAYRSNRIEEATSGFALVAGDTAAAGRDRAAASRELARSAWLIDGDEATARSRLASPAAWEDDSCATAALLVRILREAGHANEAVEAARRPHASCTQDHDELYVHEACAWADVARESGQAPRHATEGMANALDNLAVEQRHGADASRLDLDLGLLTSSPRRAFDGWTRYFWLESESAPPALRGEFPDASAVFERALGPAYGAPLEADLELLRLLVRAGFHREAARFATWRHVERRTRAEGGASWPAIASYLRFRAAVERTTLEHNRRLAHGENGGEAYEGAILGLMEQAAREVAEGTGTAGAPASETLLAAWGVHGTIGLTGGFMSLHAGHVLEDVAEAVEQDGRTGAVRRVVLDNMLANGYESWLWDGWAQAGGWAEEGTRLVQVRPSYVGSIVEALLLRRGRPARARADAELASLARRDEAALARHGLADLPGLAQRLKLQAIDQIAADIGASETERDDDTAFQSAYWNALVGGTITIHEGRHVLDQARYRDADALASEELEYRAKLSELRFAAYPRLDLAKMVVGQIGGESGHGRANSRILRELGTWVEEHAAAVQDLDPHIPYTAQIDNLTDDQLRAYGDAADSVGVRL